MSHLFILVLETILMFDNYLFDCLNKRIIFLNSIGRVTLKRSGINKTFLLPQNNEKQICRMI